MTKFKYIIWNNKANGEQLLIFGINTPHKDIAYAIGEDNIISAGFIDMDTLETSGRSVGLRILSQPKYDAKLIKRLIDLGDRFDA